jgi:hypothetical protein
MLDFIGDEEDIITPLKEWKKIDRKPYTGFNPPCFGINNCTIAGSKRKMKKVKKSKRTKKKTKKRKQKLNKTKRKNSKK